MSFIAINANNYKIDSKYKNQLEATRMDVSNGILIGKKNLKRKQKDMYKLKKFEELEPSSNDDDIDGK